MSTVHVNRDGNSLGTFSAEEIETGLSDGKFQPTDIYWTEGMPDWKLLSEFNVAPAVGSVATHQPVRVDKTDGFAITSMVLGIIGLVSCGALTAIPAVIFGHLSMRKIKEDTSLKGKGMATAGLILGYIGIAVTVIGAIIYILLIAASVSNQP